MCRVEPQDTKNDLNQWRSHNVAIDTSGSAMAEGPREALVSRNPATTKHLS